ncbi:MAG TPA: M3 family oligoendopeptidase [Kofleriaceae bacterium]|nr:M3 family oligoendopeptidase [Kofleriaceae bacterium]
MVTSAARVPDWDLSPYFAGADAPELQAFRAQLAGDLPALLGRVEALAPLDGATPEVLEAWTDALLATEDASARLRHLDSYLGCVTSADAQDEAAQREDAALAGLDADLEKVVVALQAGFKRASEAAFAALTARPRLAGAGHYLTRMRIKAAHAMATDLEGLAADLAVDGLRAWGRLYDRIAGNLTFSLEVRGRPAETHPVSMSRSLLEDADGAVRRAALIGSGAAWQRVADPVAASLNAIAGTRLTLYARRGIDHFLAPALFDAGIERATLDAMLGAVRARQEVARRFLRRKASLLGLERLGFQDLMAPLPRADAERIPWERGARAVVDAFAHSYPAMAGFAEHALARRWVDHRPRPGKRPGGFCTSSHLTGESRIFMTYHGASGDVQTLAHELGHAYHNWLMKDLRWWERRYPMTLAETASTFAEQLVIDATLADPKTSAVDRLALLDARLRDAEAFLLNIPMRFDFEHELYTRRRGGELSVAQLRELMLDAQRTNYGDALAPDQLDPWFWASKLHFYITDISFYNFPYTFGFLFSKGLFARARREGADFLPRYEALLRATGRAPAEVVARDALGVDLTRPDFWNESIDLVEDDLTQFEALAGAN